MSDLYNYEVVTLDVSDDDYKGSLKRELRDMNYRGYKLHTAISLDRGTSAVTSSADNMLGKEINNVRSVIIVKVKNLIRLTIDIP